MRQIRELGLKQQILGNEQFASAALVTKSGDEKLLLEGVVFAQPACNLDSGRTKEFSDHYTQTYQVQDLPFGCYTGESYDAVYLLADAIAKCGEDTECVGKLLGSVKGYDGASGTISFNADGDVERGYVLKSIRNGTIVELSSPDR